MTNTQPKYCHLDLHFGICDSIGHYIGTIFGEMYYLKVVLNGLIFGELISEFLGIEALASKLALKNLVNTENQNFW